MMESMDRTTASLLQGEWEKKWTGKKSVAQQEKIQFYNLSTPPSLVTPAMLNLTSWGKS